MMQTILASQKFRKRGVTEMERASTPLILDCGHDGEAHVRLLGAYSRHPENRALVIFLHGWEGSQESTYVVSTARYLFARGCSVFRLNFRDHGDSHHLNEAMFHSARFEEVFEGVKQAAERADNAPIYLVGFSLGGNFALRVARHLGVEPIDSLTHIIAISPVVDPLSASPKVDENRLVQRYFYKKWTASMRKKQAAFPHKYDFSGLENVKSMLALTEEFLPAYTEYDDLETYFNAYKIHADDLVDCPVALSIIMSEDDPVVPSGDVKHLRLAENGLLIMTQHGGHNGFFMSLFGPTWYESYLEHVIFGRVD